MTTIAYKDGVIAWDSRVTAEFVEDFCNAYAARSPTVKDMDVSAIVLEPSGKLFKAAVEERQGQFRIWRAPIPLGRMSALGSGHDFAIAFMDMGLSAEEAVQRTMRFDAATGGKVHTFQIPVAAQHVSV